MQFGLIIIGDEILSGRTKDENLGFLAEELQSRLQSGPTPSGDFYPRINAQFLGSPQEACRGPWLR